MLTPIRRCRAAAARRPLCCTLVALFVLLISACSQADSPPSGDSNLWSGVSQDLYVCEGAALPLQLSFEGTNVTVTQSDSFGLPAGTAGTVTSSDGTEKVIAFTGASVTVGRFITDASGRHALLVLHNETGAIDGNMVAVLQSGTPALPGFADADLVGNWAGTAIRVDANLAVTSSAASTVQVTNPAGLALDGSDGDGAFSAGAGVVSLADAVNGVWLSSGTVDWSGQSLDAIAVLADDKSVIAVAFVTDTCSGTVFTDMPSQKFAVWRRQ